MENRHLSEEYTLLAKELIDTEPKLEHLKNANISIAFLGSDLAKRSNGMVVYGQCEKVAAKYKWIIPFDFTITIYEPNLQYKSEEALKIVLFHELLHIGIEEENHYVIPHDLEDFKYIVDRYGTEWINK